MVRHFTCPRGHEWESLEAAGGAEPTCPVCATLYDTPPPPNAEAVLPGRPADPFSTASPAPAVPPAPASAPGAALVPGYEVLGELGHGGMGVVYKAHHLGLNRVVALKMIRPLVDAGPGELVRFRAEAEAVAHLQHPHIVQIYEIGSHDGRPFFSLEYMEGGGLDGKLRGGVLPPREAAQMVGTLAQATAYAHQKGIVHRDLKPANVLLTAEGAPKVSDFGLAKRLQGHHGLTQSGALLGTPSYMAPEQTGGDSRAVGPACDVYALGAILYECLTGRPPFRGVTALETLEQVRFQDPVPPTRLQPSCPRDLETSCLKCLRKEPAARYGGAQELADDLGRFLRDEPIRARPLGVAARLWRWRRRNRGVAGLLALLAFVVAGALTALTCLWLVAEDRRRLAETNGELASQARDKAEENYRLALQTVDDYCTKVSNDPRLGEKDLEPLRKKLLQSAVRFYEKFVEGRAGDPEVRAELGKGYARLASLTDALGDKAGAINLYGRGLAVWEELARDNPADPSHRDRQAFCHHNLALLYRDTRRPDDAEKFHKRALATQEALARDHDGVADYQLALALTRNSLGNLYRRTNRLDAAGKSYTQALTVLERLSHDHPGVADYQSHLALIHGNLGILYRRTGRPGEAERAYRQAIRLIEKVGPGPSSAAGRQVHLARNYINLGNLCDERGQQDKAEAAFKKAVELADRLARDHPAVTRYQDLRVSAHNGLGIACGAAGRTGEAEAAYNKALQIAQSLAGKHPLVSGYAVSVAGIHVNLGDLARATGRPEEGLDWLGRAIGALAAVIKKEPQNATARRFLRNAHANRGRAWSALGNHAEAMKDWGRALALEGKPGRDDTRSERALTLAHQGLYARAAEEVKPLKGNKWRPADPTLFNAARVHALASAAVRRDARVPPADRDKLAEHHAGRALDLLARARASGFFNAPSTRQDLKREKDLDPIRSHATFRKLLAELERKAKPTEK
jgi:serine/threonine-protein kinase